MDAGRGEAKGREGDEAGWAHDVLASDTSTSTSTPGSEHTAVRNETHGRGTSIERKSASSKDRERHS